MSIDLYAFTYRPYQREFLRPLITNHGEWKIRSGIIITLTDRVGRTARGEIAPIPWFGSETLAAAVAWCDRVGETIETAQILDIPDSLPSCQFGCGGAWQMLTSALETTIYSLPLCGLLPSGEASLERSSELFRQGYRTFKIKIGIDDDDREIATIDRLLGQMPAEIKLRLDANGGLNWDRAQMWLEWLGGRSQIEFLEQPLPVNQLAQMFELARLYSTPIALDESIANYAKVREIAALGWPGVYTIKPGIAGFPWRLLELIEQQPIDLVLSSAIETEIGREIALRLAAKIPHPRAMGFGIEGLFAAPLADF
jgi:o-succinylbenzoate synthase